MPTTEFALPFTEIEVANFLSRIGQVRRAMRRVDAPELQAAKEFGGKLFGAIFSVLLPGCGAADAFKVFEPPRAEAIAYSGLSVEAELFSRGASSSQPE